MCEWGGRRWTVTAPPPTAASDMISFAEGGGFSVIDDLVTLLLGEDQRDEIVEALADGTLNGSLRDLIEEAVQAGSGRPLKAVATLCAATVKSWSIVRARMVRSGVADPLRQLPSLWALLDVTESLILESKQEQKDRDDYMRQMYPATYNRFSEEDSAAAFAAFINAK